MQVEQNTWRDSDDAISYSLRGDQGHSSLPVVDDLCWTFLGLPVFCQPTLFKSYGIYIYVVKTIKKSSIFRWFIWIVIFRNPPDSSQKPYLHRLGTQGDPAVPQ